MPKAVRFHKLGGPEVLQIEESASKASSGGRGRHRCRSSRPKPG
jgi:hypothetical protein